MPVNFLYKHDPVFSSILIHFIFPLLRKKKNLISLYLSLKINIFLLYSLYNISVLPFMCIFHLPLFHKDLSHPAFPRHMSFSSLPSTHPLHPTVPAQSAIHSLSSDHKWQVLPLLSSLNTNFFPLWITCITLFSCISRAHFVYTV